MSSVSQFISEYSAKVLQLTDIFKSLPKDTQRHKTALPGALQIKKAQKTLETLAEAPEEEGFKETLLKCQVVMREVVLGMLDLTFSMEEDLASEDFGNAESVAMVQDHLDDLVGYADCTIATHRRARGPSIAAAPCHTPQAFTVFPTADGPLASLSYSLKTRWCPRNLPCNLRRAWGQRSRRCSPTQPRTSVVTLQLPARTSTVSCAAAFVLLS